MKEKKYERVNAQEAMIDINDPETMENVQRNLKILSDELAKREKENEEIDISGLEFESHKVCGDFEEVKECDNEAPKRRR